MSEVPKSTVISPAVINLSTQLSDLSSHQLSSKRLLKSVNGQLLIFPPDVQQSSISVSNSQSSGFPTPNPISVPRIVNSKSPRTLLIKDSSSIPKFKIQYSPNPTKIINEVKPEVSPLDSFSGFAGLSTTVKTEREGIIHMDSPPGKTSVESEYPDSEFLVTSDISSSILSTQPLISLAQGSLVHTALPTVQISQAPRMLIRNPVSSGALLLGVADSSTKVCSDSFQVDSSPFSPCPICGDRISGYHYGIYTCESCKGFFKRTVQNKKAFICHRKNECDINVTGRKKCPACRFQRCVQSGMKIEAVREDRQRGGRSSYDGAQSFSRTPRPVASGSSNLKRVMQLPVDPQTPVKKTVLLQNEAGEQVLAMVVTKTESSAPILLQPHTPSILEDMKAVESVMTEDDGDQECCRGKFQGDDENLFVSLLHFADHCLYRIVRWARNLPDFGSVSTDDQILLLQNCWGELLCLCCCWKSIHFESELRIFNDRSLTLEIATMLGIDQLTQRMLEFTSHLRELELASYEFIAMKTLLLFNPDVPNLRDATLIRSLQDRISNALLIFTATHSQDAGSKFCQLLARLPELSRLSNIGKEILRSRQNQGDLPDKYSLLSELLKGDTVLQTT